MFLATENHPVSAACRQHRIPAGRQAESPRHDWTYEDFFTAIQSFLSAAACRVPRQCAAQILGQPVSADQLKAISIYLVKHGHFYHPCRLALHLPDTCLNLVLNVALSADGRNGMGQEFSLLQRLRRQTRLDAIPEVYAMGNGTGVRGKSAPMFIGQWLEDYCEFHWSEADVSTCRQMMLWQADGTTRGVDANQVNSVYRQAAMILTAAYHPLTTRQIFPWYHAAGDFVAKVAGDGRMDVCLITVRGYKPLAPDGPPIESAADLMDALTVFVLGMSMRMRLDRCDGTGPVLWADAHVLRAAIAGMLQGLQLSALLYDLPPDLPHVAMAMFKRLERQTVARLNQCVLNTFHPESQMRAVAEAHLEPHSREIMSALAAVSNELSAG